MKYNTVRINNNKVYYNQDTQDMVETKTVPHIFGFYHYPSGMPKWYALLKLKYVLVKNNIDNIKFNIVQMYKTIIAK